MHIYIYIYIYMYVCIFHLVLWEHSQAFPWNNLPSNWEVRFPKVNIFISSLFSDHFLKALNGLVGLHRTVQLQLLQRYWLRHRLGLLWYWMVCLRNEQRSFCRFWDCIQVLNFGLFCWPWWLLHFFWGIPARSSRCNGHLS